jgi:hypothetical protein
MISNGYNRHNARSPVPARKIYFLQTTHLIVAHPIPGASGGTGLDIDWFACKKSRFSFINKIITAQHLENIAERHLPIQQKNPFHCQWQQKGFLCASKI